MRTIKDIVEDLRVSEDANLTSGGAELPELHKPEAAKAANNAREVVLPLMHEAAGELAKIGLAPHLDERDNVHIVNGRQALSLGKLTFLHPRDRVVPDAAKMALVILAQRGALVGCVAIPDGDRLQVIRKVSLSGVGNETVTDVIDRLVERIRHSDAPVR